MENGIDIAQLEQWFTTAEDATIASRAQAERARDYKDGKQLTTTEEAELKRRGQPPIVFNMVRRKIEWLKGLEVKQRTDPKAFPRTPQHESDADSVTDAIRYVCDDQNWDDLRSHVYDNMLIEGFGGCEIVHKQNAKGDVDVVLNHYPWDRLFYDPYSRKYDFSDARYKGVVIWQDFTDFKREYPDQSAEVEASLGETTNTYDDKPTDAWLDRKRKRVRVLLMWYREGNDWHWCKFIKGTKLDSGLSPYSDEDGASVCPLVMHSQDIARDLTRYGPIIDMFSPQDEVNNRRSKALFNINNRQTWGPKGAVKSVAEMKRQLATSDGHIEIEDNALLSAREAGILPFNIIPNTDQTSGQLSLMGGALDYMEIVGANSALAGETGESASGRAVLARQQGGMIEIAAANDKLHQFTREVYEQIWQRIRQFWTEERWVRVTDDDNNARFVGLNTPITLGEQLGEMPEEQAMQIANQLSLYPGDPRLQEQVGIRNNVAEIDVDIIIEEVPDRITLAGEVFEALMKYGPQIPAAVLIEADPSLPRKQKDKLIEMMQQPPSPSPAEQIELAGDEAKVYETQAKTQKLTAEAQAISPQYV